jgi:hypothetical protein
MTGNQKLEETLLSSDLITYPEALDKECTEEEFHEMMTSHNSDIPIERVTFVDYPDSSMGL